MGVSESGQANVISTLRGESRLLSLPFQSRGWDKESRQGSPGSCRDLSLQASTERHRWRRRVRLQRQHSAAHASSPFFNPAPPSHPFRKRGALRHFRRRSWSRRERARRRTAPTFPPPSTAPPLPVRVPERDGRARRRPSVALRGKAGGARRGGGAGEAPPASRVAFPQGERGAKGGASGARGARVEGRRTAGRAPAPETARSALGARGPGPSERRGVSPPPPQDDVDAQRRATEACCGRAHCPPASSLAPDVRTME